MNTTVANPDLAVKDSFTPTDEQTQGFKAGRYEVRFANSAEEVAAAQILRYQVFFSESDASPSAEMQAKQREQDEWDSAAYHIIVLDTKQEQQPAVVGTLRLTSHLRLAPEQAFYTESAFDLSCLKQHYQKVLELSRYCIHPEGRSGTILMLIWKFAMQFIVEHNYDVMFGCASFNGTDVEEHKDILSYLYQHNLASPHLMPKPVVDNHIYIPDLEIDNAAWDDAKQSVPTLLRGYLKLGAKISDTAIIDQHFNTVFVCIYVDAANMISDNSSLVTANQG